MRNNNSQAEELDRWESQPAWIKVIVKIWIAVELGWYAGWIMHVLQLVK